MGHDDGRDSIDVSQQRLQYFHKGTHVIFRHVFKHTFERKQIDVFNYILIPKDELAKVLSHQLPLFETLNVKCHLYYT